MSSYNNDYGYILNKTDIAHGIKYPLQYLNLVNNTQLVLSYKLKILSGSLTRLGGQSLGLTLNRLVLNGSNLIIADNYGLVTTTFAVEDIIDVVAFYTVSDIAALGDIWIQPNYGLSSAIKCQIFQVQFETGLTRTTWDLSLKDKEIDKDKVSDDILSNANAITNLKATVIDQGNTITSISNSITTLNNDLTVLGEKVNTKADSSAVSSLTSRVTNTENSITSQGRSIVELQNNLNNLGTLNSWRCNVYSTQRAANNLVHTFDELAVMSPIKSQEILDATNINLTSFGTYVTIHMRAVVTVTTAFTWSVTSLYADDSVRMFVKGVQVYEQLGTGGKAFSYNMPAGTYFVDIIFYNHGGTASLNFAPNALSSKVTSMNAATADEALNAISSYAIGGLTSTVSNVDGRLTTASSDITTLKNNYTSLDAKVNTKADSSALSTLDSKVTQQGSDLQSQSGLLVNLQNSLDTAVNSLNSDNVTTFYQSTAPTVYGVKRNLLNSNSSGRDSIWYPDNTNKTSTVNSSIQAPDGTLGVRSFTTTGKTEVRIGENSLGVSGTTYVISCWVKTNTGTVNAVLDINDLSSTKNVTITTEWQRIYHTGSSNNTLRFLDINLPSGVTVYIYGAQIEKGVIPTPYQEVISSTNYEGSGLPVGSIWYKTNDNNKPFRYDGTNWVEVSDVRVGANATAISNLNSTVTTQGNTITSQGTNITKLTNDLTTLSGTVANKADSTALATLDSKVTTQGNTITSQGSNIVSLQNSVKANIASSGDFIPNPTFDPRYDQMGFNVISSSSSEVPTGCPFPYVVKLTARDHVPSLDAIAWKVGDVIEISALVASDVNATANFNLYIYRMTSPTSGAVAYNNGGNQAPTQTWTRKTWKFTVTASYVLNGTTNYPFFKPFLQINQSSPFGSIWYVADWHVKNITAAAQAQSTADATASALSSLTQTVTNQGDTLTSQGNSLVSLTNNLNNLSVGSTNLWATSDVKSSFYVNGDGSLTGSSPVHQVRNTLLPIVGSKTNLIYQVWNPNKITNANNINRIAFFTTDNTFISVAALPVLNATEYQMLSIPIPSNAKYVRIGAIVGVSNGSVVDQSIKIKFEFGTKPTEWSQAPEDISNALDANSLATTNLSSTVTQQGSTLTSQGTDITSLKNSVSNINGTLSNKADSSAVSALDNKVTQQGNTISTQSSDITTLKGNVVTINNSLSTKADTSALNSLTTRVTSTETGISNQGTQITNLSNSLNTLSVGGNNLLLNTKLVGVSGTYLDFGYRRTTRTANSTSYVDSYSVMVPNGLVDSGFYVASFYARASKSQEVFCFLYNPDTTKSSESSTGQKAGAVNGNGKVGITLTTDWKRYWVRWEAVASSTKGIVLCRLDVQDTEDRWVDICAIKFEKGSIATDWSVAPSEIQSQIDATASAVNSLTNTVTQQGSTITSQGNSLTSLQNSVNTLNNNVATKADSSAVNNLTSRVEATEAGLTNQSSNIISLSNSLSNYMAGVGTKNRWRIAAYNKTMPNSTSVPTLSDLSVLPLKNTTEASDSDTINLTAFGTYTVTHLRCYFFTTTNATWNPTFYVDDALRVYINGVQLAERLGTGSVTATYSFVANTSYYIDMIVYNHSGSASVSFGSGNKLSNVSGGQLYATTSDSSQTVAASSAISSLNNLTKQQGDTITSQSSQITNLSNSLISTTRNLLINPGMDPNAINKSGLSATLVTVGALDPNPPAPAVGYARLIGFDSITNPIKVKSGSVYRLSSDFCPSGANPSQPASFGISYIDGNGSRAFMWAKLYDDFSGIEVSVDKTKTNWQNLTGFVKIPDGITSVSFWYRNASSDPVWMVTNGVFEEYTNQSNSSLLAANSSALTALDSKVTQQGATITSQSNQITSLNNSIIDVNNKKADASALSSLDSRVTNAEGNLNSQASSLISLKAVLGNNMLSSEKDVNQINKWACIILAKIQPYIGNAVIPDYSYLNTYPVLSTAYVAENSTLFNTNAYDNTILYYRAVFNVTAAKTIDLGNLVGDDAHAIYLDQVLVFSASGYLAAGRPVSFNVTAGNHIIDIIANNGSGGSGFRPGNLLSSQVNLMYAARIPTNLIDSANSAISSLTTRVTATESGLTNQSQSIVNLNNSLNATANILGNTKIYNIATNRNASMLSAANRAGGAGIYDPLGARLYPFARGLNLITFGSSGNVTLVKNYDVYVGENVASLSTSLANDINNLSNGVYFGIVGTDHISSFNTNSASLPARTALIANGATEDYINKWLNGSLPIFFTRKGMGAAGGIEVLLDSNTGGDWIDYPLTMVNGVPSGISSNKSLSYKVDATATALTTLSNTVTQQGNTITSQSSNITNLNNQVSYIRAKSANLVFDGSFETLVTDASNVNIQPSTTRRTGSKSLQLKRLQPTNNGNNNDSWWQDWFDIADNRSYYIEVWARSDPSMTVTPGSGAFINVGLQGLSPSGTRTWVGIQISMSSLTTTWTKFSGYVSLPTGFESAQVWFSIPSSTANVQNMSILLDDLYICDVTEGKAGVDAGAANSAAISSLTSRVVATETGISNTSNSLTSLNNTITNLASNFGGESKWRANLYITVRSANTSLLSLTDLSLLVPSRTLEINDNDNLNVTSFGNYITSHLKATLIVSTAFTWNPVLAIDDSARIYLNGTLVFEQLGVASNKNLSVNIPAGYNTFDIIVYNHTGNGYINFGSSNRLSNQSYSTMYAASYSEAVTTINSSAINNLTSTVTQQGTTLTSQSSQIVALSNTLGNIKLGGTNLYTNSQNFNSGWDLSGFNTSQILNGFTVLRANKNWGGAKQTLVYENGVEYTLSATIACDSGVLVQFWGDNIDSTSLGTKLPVTGIHQRFSMTFKGKGIAGNGRFEKVDNGSTGDYIIYAIKVEKGNLATEWSPAPEDLATSSALTQLDSKVTSVDGKVNSQASQLTTLNSTVGNQGTSINTLNTTVNGVTGRASLEINNNGVLSGWKTTSTNNNGTVYSTFGVNADSFYVGAPNDGKKVFTIENGETVINSARIPNLDAGKITTGTLDASRIRIGAGTSYDSGYAPSDLVKMGSTNLFKGSLNKVASEFYQGCGVWSSNLNNTTNTSDFVAQTISNGATGTEYVLSFWARASEAGAQIRSYWYNPNTTTKSITSEGANNTAGDGGSLFTLTTSWKRYWVKFTQTESSGNKNLIVARAYGQTSKNLTFYVAGPMFTAGNIVSDFSPSISELDDNFTALSTTINWQIITTAVDLNSYTATGRYLLKGSLSNSPVSVWAYLQNDRVDSTRITQTIWKDNDPSLVYQRIYNGSWSAWVKLNNAAEAAAAQVTANTALSTANTATTNISIVDSKIANWARSENTTLIDGRKIYTGSIFADQIAAGAITAGKLNVASLDAISGNLGSIQVGNGNISNLDAGKINTGTLNADRLAANSISGDKIVAGTITANKLVLQDNTNLWTNRYLDSSGTKVDNAPFSPNPGNPGRAIYCESRDHIGEWNSRYPVRKGDVIVTEFTCRQYKGDGLDLNAGVWCSDVNGATTEFLYPRVTWLGGVSDGWNRYRSTVTINNQNTVYGRLFIQIEQAGSGGSRGYDVCDIVQRRALGSELIIDGSISANKLSAGTITADKISSDAISAISISARNYTSYKDPNNPNGARMVLSGSLIQVYDDNNILRVKLGIW